MDSELDRTLELELCQKCNRTLVEPGLHPCPYNSDIHDDDSDCCNCCASCSQECSDDI